MYAIDALGAGVQASKRTSRAVQQPKDDFQQCPKPSKVSSTTFEKQDFSKMSFSKDVCSEITVFGINMTSEYDLEINKNCMHIQTKSIWAIEACHGGCWKLPGGFKSLPTSLKTTSASFQDL